MDVVTNYGHPDNDHLAYFKILNIVLERSIFHLGLLSWTIDEPHVTPKKYRGFTSDLDLHASDPWKRLSRLDQFINDKSVGRTKVEVV